MEIVANPIIHIRPLNPVLHSAYADKIKESVPSLLTRRAEAREDDLDLIDREIVARLWHQVLRPDEIAKSVLSDLNEGTEIVTVYQAALIVAALGEAGYPITGNGAPDYSDLPRTTDGYDLLPVRGRERSKILSDAAFYWANKATRPITYVSFGDCRGYMPRGVQYDQPGSMHPQQQASLTLGPYRGPSCNDYMKSHTRLLLLVRPDSG